MTLFNAIDLGALLLGIVLLIKAYMMDSTSSFEGGSFLNEMFLGIVGGALFVGSLLAKLIELFFR